MKTWLTMCSRFFQASVYSNDCDGIRGYGVRRGGIWDYGLRNRAISDTGRLFPYTVFRTPYTVLPDAVPPIPNPALTMEFLNLPALYALGALPLLFLPYLIRQKPKRYVFSTLLLLQPFATRPERRVWGKLRLPLIFVLQLLLLALLIGASGDPVLPLATGERLAIVLDNSASMQAMENGRTRFDLARKEAMDTLRKAPTGSRVDVYLTVPWTGVVGQDLSVDGALGLLAGAKVYDLGDAANDYGPLLAGLVEEHGYQRLVVFTDRPGHGTSSSVRVVTVGEPRDNVAVTGFDVHTGGLGSAGRSARVDIANFSAGEQRVEVVLLGNGKRLGTRRQRVAPGQNVAVPFDHFPLAPYYEVQVVTEKTGGDSLALDNRRFAVIPGEGASILGVSPRPEVLESLRAVRGLRLEVVAPEAYAAMADQKSGLEIFHLSAPGELPRNNALFILPPDENPVVATGAPVADVRVSGWRDPHPLTRYVNFSMFRPRYSRPIESKVPAHTVVNSPVGPLALVFERDGFRYAVLGFDPLPFLGQQNLPMSILMLNLLGWLRDGMTAVNQSTGDPLNLAGDVRGHGLTPAPDGVARDDAGSPDSPALFQGVYERVQNGSREHVAVNLDAPRESDLLEPLPIVLDATPSNADAVTGYQPLWPYVIMLCLFLLILEWFVNPPKQAAR